MPQARIKIGQNTRGHQAILTNHGYETRIEGNTLVVEVPGPCVGKDVVVNLTTDEGKALVRETISAKGHFTYGTRWILVSGQENPVFGIVACTKMGSLSAFVMKPAKVSGGASAPDFLADLGL